MDLKDFYRLVLRNLALVLVTTFAGIGVASGITYAITPMYEAKLQLFVSTQSSGLDISALVQGSSFSQQRVKSYAQIIPSPTLLEPVIEELRLNISAGKLAKRVKASAPLDTVLINVSVTDESAWRSAKIANTIGDNFAAYVNELELSSDGVTPPIKVSVVKRAEIPLSPATPKVALNILIGFILGFGLGIGFAILRQIFDSTIKNEQNLDGTPLLGAVGFDKDAAKKPLITQISRYGARTESFRQIRTNIQYIKADQPPRIVALTSALPGEGKTSTSINLALSLAQSGFKVALIEADLRRPKVPTYLGIPGKTNGLSEILSGKTEGTIESKLQSSIQKFGNEVAIDVLISGTIPPNPAELLDSESFNQLIEYFRTNYDFTVIDCPPSLPVADASIISTRTDGVIVVTEAGSTKINQFFGVRDSITNVGGVILGAILNKIPHARTYDDYGYRYGYGYGYRGRYGSYSAYKPYASKTEESRNLNS